MSAFDIKVYKQVLILVGLMASPACVGYVDRGQRE